MAKGFTDKDGKFRPTGNKNGLKMKQNKTLHSDGIRMKQRVKRSTETRTMFGNKMIGKFDLYDILEDVNDFKELRNRVQDNIEFTLKREKILKKDMSVILPMGALAEVRDETKDEGGFYQFDFEVFKGSNDIPFIGTAYGQISANSLIDMTVELYEGDK